MASWRSKWFWIQDLLHAKYMLYYWATTLSCSFIAYCISRESSISALVYSLFRLFGSWLQFWQYDSWEEDEVKPLGKDVIHCLVLKTFIIAIPCSYLISLLLVSAPRGGHMEWPPVSGRSNTPSAMQQCIQAAMEREFNCSVQSSMAPPCL